MTGDLFDMLSTQGRESGEVRSHVLGVVVGIVTDNQDEAGLGRVKVRLPWFSDEGTSHWARVATFMSGHGRGAYFLPEVDDEVLLAFANGDMRQPFVIGSLWNGMDRAPVSNADGKNNVRMLQSRSGHRIVLDDTEDAGRIQIVDSSGDNLIEVNTHDNAILIKSATDVTIRASGGRLSLQGASIEIKSDGQLDINGATVNIN